MTSGAAWNTRPFRPETLDAAREAARRAGLSLAEWLNSAILDTATNAGVRLPHRAYEAENPGGKDDTVSVVGDRLDELARRIDLLIKRSAEADPWRSDATPSRRALDLGPSVSAMEAGLASIVRELVPQSQAATQRLAEAIRDLNSKFDRLAASSDSLSPRTAETERAVARPHQDPANARNPAAGFSSALAEISARQRELDAEIGGQDFSRLEHQLQHITEQIEALGQVPATPEPTGGADGTSLDRIEGRILELAQKLDASDARLESLGSIERNIADLISQLKETRAAALEEAEGAARAVAGDMLSQSGAAGLELAALKQELMAFRASQAEIDQHTELALGTIHHSLERLVERLATIETGVFSAARRSPEPEQPRVVPGSRLAAASAAQPPTPSAVKLTPEPQPLAPDLPGGHPLEPGSGVPRGRPSSAATRIGAAESVLANSAPSEPTAKANFIAAARRAAQAAAAEAPPPAAAEDENSESRAVAAVGAKRRRPLMMAAGVMLFGTGSFYAAMNGHFPQLPDLNDFVRIEALLAPFNKPPPPSESAKAEKAPAPPASRTALMPDPIVPDSGAPPVRRPVAAPRDDLLLSPVPDAGVKPAGGDPQPQGRAPASAAPWPPVHVGEITGALPPAQPSASTKLASQRPAREPTSDPAARLPNDIGDASLRSAALGGDAAAEYEVGIRFSEGRGIAQNFDNAAFWFTRAADHGLAPAQYRLGSLYEKGQGVKKDIGEARRLYLAAAQQGNAKAMHNLAVLYAVGLDGSPDYKSASGWFQKAADHGVADSQYNLGILYARGIGVEQNFAESYKWFALAAQKGDKDAVKKRDDVAAQLDPQALAAARLVVQSWTANPEPEQATKVESSASETDRAPANAPPAKPKPARRTGAPGSA